MDILKQLKAARDKAAFELGRLEAAISALSGSGSKSIMPTGKRRTRKKMTADHRPLGYEPNGPPYRLSGMKRDLAWVQARS